MTFIEPRLENEIIKVLKKEKELTVFDVGCYRGVFSKKIL
jgi:2-polyprenyl-3-methyl-5-hydroxy-6-metoxy-1,4-benzoquinol methylase